jgi:hypothetical protein
METNSEINSNLKSKLKILLENTKRLNQYNNLLKGIQEKSIVNERINNEKMS